MSDASEESQLNIGDTRYGKGNMSDSKEFSHENGLNRKT